jgi:arabinose-5-phosphate isomerase
MLALGDALAIACLDARGFGPEDFARSHPGGALGRKLLLRVADVMRSGARVPQVPVTATVMQAVHEISEKQMSMTAVVQPDGTLAGIFTDGDLRKLLERAGDIRSLMLADVFNRTPLTIGPDALAAEAAQLLDARHRNQLLVTDAQHKLVGALHVQDLMAAKVI